MLFRTLAIVFVCCASFFVTPTSRAALLPFHDDFSDGNATDGMPGTWIEGFGGNWDATSGDLTVTHAHGEQPYTYMHVQELAGLRDVSITTDLRFTQLTGARDFADVWARNPGTDFGAYWGGIRDDGLLGIGRENIDGSVVIFNTAITSLDPVSKDVSIRLDVIGNSISLFAWQSGDPLPDSPQLTAHDSVFAEGGLMGVAYQPNVLGGTSAGSVAFRYFTVVPEPSTIALVSIAVAAIGGGVVRRRRYHTAPSRTRRLRVDLATDTPLRLSPLSAPRNGVLVKSGLSVTLPIAALFSVSVPTVRADSFGNGANQFDIEFVPIGNPDNPDDSTGAPNPAGKVEYAYRMGKYEISEDMINKANALGGLGITHDNRGANKPATSVTWFEAATFVNWLNTSTGHTPAYKFDGGTFELWQAGGAGFNSANQFRNSQAFYFLPSADEWYKAAYYDPTAGVYYDYPTGSDTAPTAVANGTAADTAVYDQLGPADITLAGGLSPYGTTGQGGNVWEWEETKHDLVNDSSSLSGGDRGDRGGGWKGNSDDLLSSVRYVVTPLAELSLLGFRVASIPEPSTLLMGALASVGLLLLRRSH